MYFASELCASHVFAVVFGIMNAWGLEFAAVGIASRFTEELSSVLWDESKHYKKILELD